MWKQMKAKYPGTCRRCYKKIKIGQLIEWHMEKHTSRHVGCEKGSVYTYGGKSKR